MKPGSAHEPHSLSNLPDGVPAKVLIADKASDTNATPAMLSERGHHGSNTVPCQPANAAPV